MKVVVLSASLIPSRTANSIQTMKMSQAFAQLGHTVRLLVPGDLRQADWPQLKKHYGLKEEFEIKWLKTKAYWRRYDLALRAVAAARRWGSISWPGLR